MSDPICRTDRASNEQRPVSLKEFFDSIGGYVESELHALGIIASGKHVETSSAFYTLSAQWLFDGHQISELESLAREVKDT